MQNKAGEVTRDKILEAITSAMRSEAFERFYAEEVCDVKSSWKIALTVIYIFSECWKAAGVTLSTAVLLKDTDVVKQPAC